MESFVVVPHLAADSRRAVLVRHFAEDEDVAAILLIGDVTGQILSEGELLLYRQVQELFADVRTVQGRVAIARAYLAQPGMTEAYRDAVRFYLSRIADMESEERVVWKEAFYRSCERLVKMREAFGGRRCIALADTLITAQVFAGNLLDYGEIEIGKRIVKGVGLSPRERISVPVKDVPVEYRDELPGAIAIEKYARDYHIFVANAYSPSLQRVLSRSKWRLTILPGQTTDATSFGGAAFAFESPGTFSLFKCREEGMLRQAYQFVGNDARLFRTDTFDSNFKLCGTTDDMNRMPRLFLGRSQPAPAFPSRHAFRMPRRKPQ